VVLCANNHVSGSEDHQTARFAGTGGVLQHGCMFYIAQQSLLSPAPLNHSQFKQLHGCWLNLWHQLIALWLALNCAGGGTSLPVGPPKPVGPPRISFAGGRASTTGELLEIMGLVVPPVKSTAGSAGISTRPSLKSEAHTGGHTTDDEDSGGFAKRSLGAASTQSHPKAGTGITIHQQQQKGKWEPPPLMKRASLVLPRGFSEHWAQLLALGERMGQ
jgi:hypothetical protein